MLKAKVGPSALAGCFGGLPFSRASSRVLMYAAGEHLRPRSRRVPQPPAPRHVHRRAHDARGNRLAHTTPAPASSAEKCASLERARARVRAEAADGARPSSPYNSTALARSPPRAGGVRHTARSMPAGASGSDPQLRGAVLASSAAARGVDGRALPTRTRRGASAKLRNSPSGGLHGRRGRLRARASAEAWEEGLFEGGCPRCGWLIIILFARLVGILRSF